MGIISAAKKYARLVFLIPLGALLFLGFSCSSPSAAPSPTPPPPGVQYDLASDIKLTKITWSLKKVEGTDWLQCQLELTNTGSANQIFEAAVDVDDLGASYSGPITFEPGKAKTVTLMTTLHTIQPQKIFIQAVHAKPLPTRPPKPS